MKKKWTMALTVLVLFAVLLSGCGGSSGSSGSSNASGSSDASGSSSSNNGDVGASAEQEPAGDLLDKITEAGVLVIGTEGTYAPNSYHDEDGNLTGFDVEVARAIAGKLGVEAQFVEAEWDSLFASMDSGRVDVVINEVEYSEARAEKYDFSAPYTYVHGALLVAEDNGDITSFDDLKGKKAAQNLTSSWGQMAESYGAEIVSVDAIAQTMEQIVTGRADATLNAETAFYYYLTTHPDTPVKIVATTDSTTSSRVPVPKGNERLLAAIDQALEELRAEGTLTELSQTFFGSDITNE